ncbi:Cellulose synthase [Quillaja saponaria]|uniref:Cellulose synthase n=1 Tax=Quillaja saponaria TaxID=32244 RepID=A0AAD7LSP2_QUISA|nr:Cellulose synthase [Quillaja saponaria]
MGKQDVGGDKVKEISLLPLFETKQAGFRGVYKMFASTIFVGICLIWLYRLTNIPRAGQQGRWAWFAMFMAELCFGLYWICTQSVRWNVVYQHPFKERLSHRYENKLPAVDIFVCTADPKLEPPSLVINTVLSVMFYNYPPNKLSVYLSDDGGSELTFYALLEASSFSKHWIPFCKKFMVEPRSPEAYFAKLHSENDSKHAQERLAIKKLYEEMKNRIESALELGKVPEDIRKHHKGFLEWNPKIAKQDHQSIVQIIIDGRDTRAVDNDGCQLPTLVYMAREKRPQWPHHFKAGAMNALIRVSSEISNAPVILNLDCDMYANNADTVREALCFFMDEAKGQEIAYVQFPQYFDNITKNNLYSNSLIVIYEIELAGIGGYGAAMYIGTGCFHRRESLSGMYFKDHRGKLKVEPTKQVQRTVNELEEAAKVLASFDYELDTQWGKEMGLIYGCSVEDVITGLAILCKGWKSVYYIPNKKAFLGVAPTTLNVALVQQKRWAEGLCQILFSKYCPFIHGHRKIKLAAQLGYSAFLLWAPISLPTLCYVIVPPICLLRGISLFPELTSLWFLPFTYVFVTNNTYSLFEAMWCGLTFKAWWHHQTMVVIRRTTSYFFGFIDNLKKILGLSETKFAITSKLITEDVSRRYEQEVIEFGSSSTIFNIISTLALLNLFGFVGGIKKIVIDLGFKDSNQLTLQIMICALMILVNLPVYEALFVRNDKGCLPSSVMINSIVLASVICWLVLIF